MSYNSKVIAIAKTIRFITFLIFCQNAFSANIPAERGERNFDIHRRKTASVEQKTNFCDLFEQVETGNIELRNALANVNISVGVYDRYAVNKTTGKINENYTPVLVFDEVAKRARFNWRENFEIVDSPTLDQTWTDVLYYTLNNYDLALDFYHRMPERLDAGVTFPQDLFDSRTIMTQVKKSNNNKWANTWYLLLMPFTWEVWLLLLATMIITAIAYYLIVLITHRENEGIKNFGDSLFFSFQALTGTSKFSPTHAPNRILLISLRWFCIYIVAAFTSSLTAFLVSDANTNEVNVNVFEDAIHNNYRICVERGASDSILVKRQYPTGIYIEKETGSEAYKGLNNGECEIALTRVRPYNLYKNSAEHNPNCNIQWIGEEVLYLESSFPIKASAQGCSSLLRDVLDLHMLEMSFENNTLERIIAESQKTENNCNLDIQRNDSQLTVSELAGAFMVHAILLVISVVSSIVFRVKSPKDSLIAKKLSKLIDTFSERYSYQSKKNEMQDAENEDENFKLNDVDKRILRKMMIDLHTELKNELAGDLNIKPDEPEAAQD